MVFISENSPCIAQLDKVWYRGIVWEIISTNRYKILFVDTLKIIEVKRILVQDCPKDLLHTNLKYMKVRLSKITPNPRLRAQDLCDQLSHTFLDKKICLFARIVQVQNDDVPEINLYENEQSKRSICKEFIAKKFYKKLK